MTGWPKISEDELKAMVIETAKLYGWRICHFRPAQNRAGKWMTPIEGDAGLPDLVLARDGYVLLVELKSERGGFRPGQREWLAALGQYGRCWRPSDRQTVINTLRRHP